MAAEKNLAFLKATMWGPNAIRQAEDGKYFNTIQMVAKVV
jgi:hypothetical protein